MFFFGKYTKKNSRELKGKISSSDGVVPVELMWGVRCVTAVKTAKTFPTKPLIEYVAAEEEEVE